MWFYVVLHFLLDNQYSTGTHFPRLESWDAHHQKLQLTINKHQVELRWHPITVFHFRNIQWKVILEFSKYVVYWGLCGWTGSSIINGSYATTKSRTNPKLLFTLKFYESIFQERENKTNFVRDLKKQTLALYCFWYLYSKFAYCFFESVCCQSSLS